MNFEGVEIDNTGGSLSKSKVKGVIVLTDNRNRINVINDNDKDVKVSACKENEAEVVEFSTGLQADPHEENAVSQLTKRLALLQEKVAALSKFVKMEKPNKKQQQNGSKKKNRRKFKQLIRDSVCPICQKVYGSDTALKYHLKLKHKSSTNHSQSQ